MADDPVLPEVRPVTSGQVLRLCRCGRCACLPDAAADCPDVFELTVARQRHLLLCRCGRSTELPYCDGRSHAAGERWFSGLLRK
ncbi:MULTISPECIES: CDGSH iron-sulfur domain-containing protein [Pseudomonas nitroreducens/multiresinivorans group]|uniref:CDGSH iron-sulfur domain-containing protein n=1 Tax=Pseudomonas nitroreducens/multiresinivorans group TaxID=627141 RepID=UPI001F10DFA6|nr:CDGSH iron-sulfur domain-containing protein [Pseudomonas multiresinivorans]